MWLHLSIRRGKIKFNKTFCVAVCVRLSAQTVKRQLNELEEWKRSVKNRKCQHVTGVCIKEIQ